METYDIVYHNNIMKIRPTRILGLSQNKINNLRGVSFYVEICSEYCSLFLVNFDPKLMKQKIIEKNSDKSCHTCIKII